MNVLSLVFSILFILAFGFYACLEKESATRGVHKTFLSQSSLRRKLSSDYENEAYKAIRAIKNPSSSKKPASETAKQTPKRKKSPLKINLECAKLNMWPLLKQEKEDHPELYQILSQLLEHFYQKPLFSFFPDRKELSRNFLDAWLKELRKTLNENPEEAIVFEKIAFEEKELQILYYNMLRGSKGKYPPLLDFVKAAPSANKKEKICLLHATPLMLSVFFQEAAEAVYEEMHSETLAVSEERVEEICRNFHCPIDPKAIFPLVNFSRFSHPPIDEITLLAEDAEISLSLRKKIHRNG